MDPILAKKVRREVSLSMFPTISGEAHKGSHLPLTIKAVERL
jgi:hypothetical protein